VSDFVQATEKQVKFAKAIADKLGIPLPDTDEKKAYWAFINKNKNAYYARVGEEKNG